MRFLIAGLALALTTEAAAAPVTVTFPDVRTPAGYPLIDIGKTYIINADGTIAQVGSSGGSSSNPSTDGSGTITTGGTPQALFGGATPAHGFKVAIPVTNANASSFVCFVSDTTTTPSATTPGSYPVYAGGQWATETGEQPAGPVYLSCPTTGTPFSAKRW